MNSENQTQTTGEKSGFTKERPHPILSPNLCRK
jgi:hypothetical protein